ncbi:MAG TPA: single-stranded-DNA-specific exonuclease RecJ [Patescibacteria group bacterium]|nr:single-stranded-DNA-specific exonuclease RecJ [Patescibacteria group bacterium]
MKWKILSKKSKNIIETLLKNRGITTEKQKKEFFNPTDPMKITLKSIGVKESEIKKAIARIKEAREKGEHVIIYGDYDADGISGTATMWEALHEAGVFVLPHIPERFSEGYGLNIESVKRLKEKDPDLGLIITVDHGITVGKKVKEVKDMGIDMIISDHHQMGSIKPTPLALIYTTEIGGSAVAWFFAREILKALRVPASKFEIKERLELAAIGTIADQLPLKEANRSVVKYGLIELNGTRRPGLRALIEEARIKDDIGTYEVGFMIAPRINSMGRLKHGIESLRLLCTNVPMKARQLAADIGRTNFERQRIVDEVIIHARKSYKDVEKQSVIILAHETYHEGVIGLAAAKLVEEFYRPAIVLSKKGDVSKASARSIPGFNIIEAIRKLEGLYIEGGGHPMAAGFSIHTLKIEEFGKKLNKIAQESLTPEILSKKLTIDVEVSFSDLTPALYNELVRFEPTGLGNPGVNFLTKNVEILEIRAVGRDSKHLKLKLKHGEHIFDSIFFGGGENYSTLTPGVKADVVFRLQENTWNGRISLQLVIKDLRIYN